MPNWCHNKLTVTGPDEVLQRFAKDVAGEHHGEEVPVTRWNREAGEYEDTGETRRVNQPLSFQKIKPMPEELSITSPPHTDEEKRQALKNQAKHGAPTWYEWCANEWGTKWDASFDGVFCALGTEQMEVPEERVPVIVEGTATYAFETAWSPPAPVLAALVEQWPALHFVMEWAEPGCEGAGVFKSVDDELVHEDAEVEDVLEPAERWF